MWRAQDWVMGKWGFIILFCLLFLTVQILYYQKKKKLDKKTGKILIVVEAG